MSRKLITLSVAILAATTAIAFASVEGPYKGSSQDGRMSFSISKDGRSITNFRFVNACPADSNKGTLVNGRMSIKGNHFDRGYGQFRIHGHFTSDGARGTAQNDTGDCHSGKLTWHAEPVHDR
jgi:hypothetical protein